MRWWERLIGASEPLGHPTFSTRPSAAEYKDLNDPALQEMLRGESAESASGVIVTPRTALRNSAVLRCYTLISNSIGRLPLHLLDKTAGSGEVKATGHPLYQLLHRKPNDWQTAFEFRRLMQGRALLYGNAYALPIWSRGQVRALIPLHPNDVTPRQASDWTVTYERRQPSGGTVFHAANEIMHIRGPGDDALCGDSLVKLAGDVIGLSIAAERSANRIFKNGTQAGGSLSTDKILGEQTIHNLRKQFEDLYSGPDNAGRWLVLEEGLKAEKLGMSNRDAQHIETRKHQVEEIGRVFGVPRPFLMLDDTSWGSGIEQLGIYLVQHGLAPWFESWEQQVWRVLLTPADQERYEAKFNYGALLLGAMKDQAEYIRRLVGAGQGPQIMEVNEARGFLNLGDHPNGSGLSAGMGETGNA
jgi:HK97 family phage portal protein